MTDQKIPTTFEEAVNYVVNLPDADEFIRKEVAKGDVKREHIVAMLHHSLGRSLRGSWKLWQPESAALRQDIWNSLTPEKQAYYRKWWNGEHQGETMHADDASSTVIDEALVRLLTKRRS